MYVCVFGGIAGDVYAVKKYCYCVSTLVLATGMANPEGNIFFSVAIYSCKL